MPKWRFYSLAVLTVIWTVFQLYIKLVKPLDPWFQLPLHMCLALVVVWLYNPMVEKSKSHNKLWWIYDIFLIASSCFICWFFLSHAEQLNYRIFNVDVMTTTEVIVAVLLVINVMEAVRRVVSMSLFWVICFFLAYAWFGQYIPGLFRFSGISFPKLMEVLMYGENGIFGSPLVTSLGTLFYFLVFGTFFSNCGGGGVLIDGGMKLSDKTVGGPAKAAVISSGLLGMVSGSAIANVSTTGVLTIPLMKRPVMTPKRQQQSSLLLPPAARSCPHHGRWRIHYGRDHRRAVCADRGSSRPARCGLLPRRLHPCPHDRKEEGSGQRLRRTLRRQAHPAPRVPSAAHHRSGHHDHHGLLSAPFRDLLHHLLHHHRSDLS